MADLTLIEGRLSFSFTDVDFAEKYDEWSHYSNVYNSACTSSKAVDFIVSKNNEAWLIEVKDYRRHRRTKPSDLADEVMLKIRDTMAGLVSAKFRATNNNESKIAMLFLSKKRLRIALHLEQPQNPSRLFPQSVNPANVLMKLKQNVRFADAHPILVNINTFPDHIGRVTSI